MNVKDVPEIKKLSTAEKILLVEDLWDNIASDESVVENRAVENRVG